MKKGDPYLFFFSELPPLLELWPFEFFLKKNLVSRISQKDFKLEA